MNNNMEVTLYMAISIDGYIAKTDGNSEWISEYDIAMFDQKSGDADCVIVGYTTYKQYLGEVYPIPNKHNIVVSSQTQKSSEKLSFTSSPEGAIQIAQKKGHKHILLVGGGHINGSFLQKNLINKIIIDIQPIILGEGIKLFENISQNIDLEFINHQKLDGGLNILTYKVKK